MASSLDNLIRDLRKFEGRKEVVKELRKEIRKPLPDLRKAIKRRALDTLPHGNGLGAWVSRISVTARIRLSGRAAGVSIKGGRNSVGARSDINAIDRGRVRAPSWGRRGKGAWHNQEVRPGFFTETVGDVTQWREACSRAADQALDTIRRGR
jgi:hypothetical protein